MGRDIGRWLVLLLTVCLVGCGGEEPTTPAGTDSDDTGANSAVCQMIEDLGDCGACVTATTTCTYGDVSVTELSCQQCQAMTALYIQLCDAGNTDSQEDLEEGIVCTDSDL